MDSKDELKQPLLSGETESIESLTNNSIAGVVINSSDETIKVKAEIALKVYKRRWYVLLMFSLYCFTQNAVWNTWGPISSSSKEAFSWSDATIAWLNNWGPVAYVVCGLFFPWLLQVKGLRWAVVPSMFCVFIGTVCRVITSDENSATILIHIGQFLNGIAGPVGMGGMPTLSAIWFPANERITATAIGTSISVLGSALPFVLGPFLVSDGPPNLNVTTTAAPMSTSVSSASHLILSTMEPGNVTAARIQRERDEIMKYMYYSCGFAGLIFLIILIYFPAKPPHPPCLSASVEREKYWSGLWSLRSKKYFVLLAVIYGVSLGVINCWASVLNVNLSAFSFTHVDEDQAGWIGFYATLGSFAGSLLIGRFASLFARQMKLFILVMFLLSAGCFTVFALVLVQVIPSSYAILYISVIGGNTLVNSAVPLIYELGCELAYPTSEGAANGFLTYLNNVGGLIFLAVFLIPNVGTMWMNWTAIGSIVVCLPMILALKGRFNRLEVDESVSVQKYVEQAVDSPPPYGIQSS
ncbi:solute carrier family 49 member 4-like isoform X2 [Biomphalaria glabrata]|nr:solute carrier family 49 member 4-like isoform X2 [Biomphalaria glabrata]XP_055860565.1 solute carrier family 49 member 4-like isoform X2 [Biomphalaria glabrata]XP_055860566.1 solute carrier family 49 member 4-like isoform X2 [Biomphalaria glabrata]